MKWTNIGLRCWPSVPCPSLLGAGNKRDWITGLSILNLHLRHQIHTSVCEKHLFMKSFCTVKHEQMKSPQESVYLSHLILTAYNCLNLWTQIRNNVFSLNETKISGFERKDEAWTETRENSCFNKSTQVGALGSLVFHKFHGLQTSKRLSLERLSSLRKAHFCRATFAHLKIWNCIWCGRRDLCASNFN